MSDTLQEHDDDEELIIVETDELPTEDSRQSSNDEEEDDEDEDKEDRRLSADEDDEHEDDSPGRKKRLKRRQIQKLAKEAAQAELRQLRDQNNDLMRRLSAVEGNTLSQNESALEQKLFETQREIQQAEIIIARAIEAGNGDDAATAIRLRDDAKTRILQLETAKSQVSDVRVQHQQQANRPVADPRVVNLAQQWMSANPWYTPDGRNEESAITNVIDSRLVAEGFDPATPDYYRELTRRVSARLGGGNDVSKADKKDKRKAPPMGSTREHAPVSTKREVYVTPERKQAMIDAGYWEDPQKRSQMLKAYQAHDRNSAR